MIRVMAEVKCPKCGSNDLSFYAFSIAEDCGVICKNCGFSLETEVSWEGCDTIEEHDEKGREILIEMLENHVACKK